MQIISISIVRNEADILESFVRYHLQFFDRMVFINHRSTDDTLVKLSLMEQEGLPIVICNEQTSAHNQAEALTTAMHSAARDYAPSWILPLDADEFLVPTNHNDTVHSVLNELEPTTLHALYWQTYVPTPSDNPNAPLFRRITHRRKDMDYKHPKMLVPCSLASNTQNRLAYGNHSLFMDEHPSTPYPAQPLESLALAHFPIRSGGQLARKVLNAWPSNLARSDRGKNDSYHWKPLFDQLKNDTYLTDEELQSIATGYSTHEQGVRLLYDPHPHLLALSDESSGTETPVLGQDIIRSLADSCEKLSMELTASIRAERDVREAIQAQENIVKELKKRNESLAQKHLALQDEATSLTKERKEIKDQLFAKETERKEYKKQNHELKAQATHSKILQKENAYIRLQTDVLRRSMERLQDEYSRLVEEEAIWILQKQEHDILKKEYAELSRAHKAATKEAAFHMQETRRLRTTYSWKITAPLRRAKKRLKKIRELPWLIRFLRNKQPPASATSQQLNVPEGNYTVDIIICVHNALDHVKKCLSSVCAYRHSSHRIIIVDDGSDRKTQEYLHLFAAQTSVCVLLRNEYAVGYTKAANQGMKMSTAPMVILLNSDTVVTDGWTEKLLECANSNEKIGLAGPLSNAASWQSVPRLKDANGGWHVNALPEEWTPDEMAKKIADLSGKRFPRVPLLNGFCLLIKRSVLNRIGLFDEQNFPNGFGEENDFCLRALHAGYRLAVADHAYVYHAKSQSYTSEGRLPLAKKGTDTLNRKYGEKNMQKYCNQLENNLVLQSLRDAVSVSGSDQKAPKHEDTYKDFRVLFVLPTSPGGGGVHSIVQEAEAMNMLGAYARIAILQGKLDTFKATYTQASQQDLFIAYENDDELIDIAKNFMVIVGTIYHSMVSVHAVAQKLPHILPAYYIQDYEPLFFHRLSRKYLLANTSYTLVPNAVLFAKTEWIRSTVSARHDVAVHPVTPSIDHRVFFPLSAPEKRSTVRVAAMIRPRTPRRGAERTAKILTRIKEKFGSAVDIHTFGCEDAELPSGIQMDTHHGILLRQEVGALLRRSDIFVDYSDYQAFGRTGIEAMACGCAVILPSTGGAGEFAIDGENALLVDTSDTGSCVRAIRSLIEDTKMRTALTNTAVVTTQKYTTEAAARSELDLLRHMYKIRYDNR